MVVRSYDKPRVQKRRHHNHYNVLASQDKVGSTLHFVQLDQDNAGLCKAKRLEALLRKDDSAREVRALYQ